MHAGSALPIRDQNISPPIPHGYGHNQRTQQDLYRQMQQEQYTSLQHQARLALLAAQLQQQQEKHALEQYHKQQTIQQQQQRLFAIHQQQPPVERERLAAQVQANLLARTTRQKNLDDAETRARFESVPNTPTNLRSPFGVENTARVSPFARPDSMWSATTPVTVKAEVTSTPSTFSQFRPQPASTPSVQQQAPTKPQGLSAILSRRGLAQVPTLTNDKPDEVYSTESSRTTSATTTLLASPTQISEKDTEEKPESAAIKALGLGRPNNQQNRPVRAWSTPSGTATSTAINTPIPTPRSASQPVNTAVHAVRQPFGPPGNMEKLKEENFKSMYVFPYDLGLGLICSLRKRAGLKLGMLNRRVSPTTPCATLEEEE
jgi:hypothetical protein